MSQVAVDHLSGPSHTEVHFSGFKGSSGWIVIGLSILFVSLCQASLVVALISINSSMHVNRLRMEGSDRVWKGREGASRE